MANYASELPKAFSQTRYRLSASATPSPNDYMELGNKANFGNYEPSRDALPPILFMMGLIHQNGV